METKAAKTLGIIVGCFICCWFPFFTMYLVTAFCDDCIPKMAFSIIFWLGYCNSAINPFIYAAFSRDFRGAFKKIICKMLCRRPAQDPPRGIFMALHPRNVGLGPAAVSLHSVAQQSQNRSIGPWAKRESWVLAKTLKVCKVVQPLECKYNGRKVLCKQTSAAVLWEHFSTALHYEFSSVLGRINSNFPNHCFFPRENSFLVFECEICLLFFLLNLGFEP